MVHTTKKPNNTDSTAKKKKLFVRPEYISSWQQPPLTEEEREILRTHIKSEEERFKRMRENNKKSKIELNFEDKKIEKNPGH